MLVRIALVSPPGPGFDALEQRLRLDPRLQIGCFTELEAVRLALPQWPFHAMIARVPRFDESALAMAAKLRQVFPKQGILFAAETTSASALHRLREIPGCAAIDEAREIGDVAKIALKIASGQAAGPRAHPRARREGPLELRDEMGRPGVGRFLDFGPMGARVQAASLGLSRKSRVTLAYASSADPQRVHRIEAVVAWVQPSAGPWDSLFSGVRATETLGLRFIAFA